MDKNDMVLAKLMQLLSEKGPLYQLSEYDLSKYDYFDLMNSSQKQHCLCAFYLMPFLSPNILDMNMINQGNNSAKNFANYCLANQMHSLSNNEVPSPHIEQLNQNMRSYPNIAAHYTQLSKELAAMTAAKESPMKKTDAAKSMTLLIHGTWAATASWWKKNSPFWNYINQITHNVYAGDDPFFWSGANDHKARVLAADALLTWLDQHPSEHLTIIAHSHGGNVALLASEHQIKIDTLILLGTPIRLEYIPHLKNIKKIHNVFSTADIVQSFGTIPNRRNEGKTLGDSAEVENKRADNNGQGKSPAHTELHTPATWDASQLNMLLT
jgi:pimeloyl-ACP methyl ester carboxylesterase